VQVLRRPGHPTFAHHRRKDPQVGQVHTSHPMIENIIIIHFFEWQAMPIYASSVGGHAPRLEQPASIARRKTMTKAYWIVRVSVNNDAQYPSYLEAARPAFEKFGARFVVRGGRYEAMEGTSRERNVVVEFKDYDTAQACYNSPEYQAAKAIRNANADADFVIVEGVAA
jgi:uncharacterized protein (DUF1330 family)